MLTFNEPFSVAAPLTFSWSKLVPVVLPPISISTALLDEFGNGPVINKIPGDAPGLI